MGFKTTAVAPDLAALGDVLAATTIRAQVFVATPEEGPVGNIVLHVGDSFEGSIAWDFGARGSGSKRTRNLVAGVTALAAKVQRNGLEPDWSGVDVESYARPKSLTKRRVEILVTDVLRQAFAWP